MAESKNTVKADKVMDVSHPGKTSPPSSAKPIIVTNRPLIKQDPILTSPTPESTPEGRDPADLISRVGKSIRIKPLDGDNAATPVIAAPTKENEAAASETKPPAASSAKISIKPLIVTDGSSSETTPPAPSDAVNEHEIAAPVSVPATEPATPAAESPSDQAAVGGSAEAPAPEKPLSEPVVPPQAAESSAEAGSDEDTDVPKDDKQLTASKSIEDAKKKEDEQKAARDAEVESIIESKKYFLPIHSAEARRGMRAALTLLVVVLALALIWLDVALDAGIVHFGGVHALTHLFSR